MPTFPTTAWKTLTLGLLLASAPTHRRVQAQPVAESAELRASMGAFVRAREFRDYKALKAFHSQFYLVQVQDTTRARYLRFRTAWPAAQALPTDSSFRRFMAGSIGANDTGFLEALANAFQILEEGDPEQNAALVILSFVYQFRGLELRSLAALSHSRAPIHLTQRTT